MKVFNIFVQMMTAAAVVSCSFLDRDPADFITRDDIKVENDVKRVLNGAYSALLMNREQPVSLDFITDNGYCNDPKLGENVFWRMAQTPQDTKLTLGKWSRNYAGILRANSVIQYAQDVVYPTNANEQYSNGPERRNNQIAQAKILRAYFYADLVDYYGDCPWRTEPEGLVKKISPRVDKNTIINNILLDIDESLEYLPVEYTNPLEYGKITKGAALALKARICLYAGYWNWCIDACRRVKALNVYELEPYSKLFTEEYEKNKEYIFTIQYVTDKIAEGASAIWWSKYSASNQYQVSYNLADDFYMIDGRPSDDPESPFSWTDPYAKRDPRLFYTVSRYTSAESELTTTSATGLKMKKLVLENPEKIHNNDGQDFPLIRYADVLLMLAEALVETDVYDYAEVCSLVDAVRQREDVGMPKIADAEEKFIGRQLNTDQLRNVVRHERRVELALEGLRMSDIRRWDIGPEAMTDCLAVRTDGTTWHVINFASREFDHTKGYLWPIPAIEVQNNPMQNNPGYYD